MVGLIKTGEEITLAHRPTIERLLYDAHSPLSEYSFANLFLFRSVHQYRFMWSPFPHVLGTTYDGVRYAMSLTPMKGRDPTELLGLAACIFPVMEDIAKVADVFGLRAEFNDDDSDYVFDARKLAALDGHVLRGKRAQAQAFARESSPSIVQLTDRNIDRAIEVLELWDRQVDRPSSATDSVACLEALENFASLGLRGILIEDSTRQPCAFLLAQALGTGSIAVHFAKGNREQPGVYPFMFSQYAGQCGAEWLNFEQDMGKTGLRRAKRALDPAYMLHKYRLFRSRT